MSQELCWKCKEKFKKEEARFIWPYPRAGENPFPWIHCHHEPKEKPKCWCDQLKTGTAYRLDSDGFYHSIKTNFCPECGKKL